MQRSHPLVSRRAVIGTGALAAAGAWLAGCTPAPAVSLPAGTGATRPPTSAHSATPEASPTPERSPAHTATPVPTREELVQKYAGRAPREWGTDVTGVPSQTAASGVLLTLDLCGGPGGSGLDRQLIDLLIEHSVPAGVFVNARWIDANPGVVEQLVATDLIDLGNHGTTHRPLSVTGRAAYGINGTRNVGAAFDEVLGCHEKLTALTGVAPRWFRSGTAHYDEVAVEIARELGEIPVGFSVNGDAGATSSTAETAAALRTAKPGDIVLAHANRPAGSTFEGFARALPQLIAEGTRFIRLSAAGLT